MTTCNVYGYIVDGADQPIEGIKIQFFPAAMPAVMASSGKGVHPITLSCLTSSTGYFNIDLLVSTNFIVVINSFGMKEKIRIPDEASVNLFTLTSAESSGDDTPDDPGGEPDW